MSYAPAGFVIVLVLQWQGFCLQAAKPRSAVEFMHTPQLTIRHIDIKYNRSLFIDMCAAY